MSTEHDPLPAGYYGAPPKSGSRPPARPEDVASTARILHALYACISGPAGQPRDWERLRSLCVEGARFIRTGRLEDGSTGCNVMRVEDYVRQIDGWLVQNGFFEREVHRAEQRFGHVAHVLSTYESRKREDDPAPFMRGINSVQLLFDGARWWIVSVMWQHESPEDPIPPEYSPP